MINCVILAGSSEKKLQDKHNKAFVNINSKPMICYVVEALKSSGIVDKIAVVGQIIDSSGLKEDIDYVIDDRGSIIDNVLAGIECFGN
ncbi:NTP transferase domain-containing protein, partial [Methanosarcina mazei]